MQVLEHEREGRSGVGHGVGAVEHDKPVELVVTLAYLHGQLLPVGRVDVRRVDGRIELYVLYVIIQFLDFRHVVDKVREIKRLKRACIGIFNHTDCTSGVYKQNFRARHVTDNS